MAEITIISNYKWMFGVPQGWQCPVCQKVHAPFIRSCNCHLAQKTMIAPTDETALPLGWPDSGISLTDTAPYKTGKIFIESYGGKYRFGEIDTDLE